jgi:dolichol-phosphate mannosyltransferase
MPISLNPNDLEKLYNACHFGDADLAIGSRYVTGVNVVNWPLSRVLLSYFASVYVKFITGMKRCHSRIYLLQKY